MSHWTYPVSMHQEITLLPEPFLTVKAENAETAVFYGGEEDIKRL